MRFLSKSPNSPTSTIPQIRLRKKDFSPQPKAYAACWLGHSSTFLELDGIRILIDPVLENASPIPGIVKRYENAPLRREDLPEIDILLITHDHYDHLEANTIKYLASRDLRFVVPLGVASRLKGWGVAADKISELGWGQSFLAGTLQITSCKTIHYSGRSRSDRNKTLWSSYVIKGKTKNIFWSGDSGYGDHFKKIGDSYGPFDLAFVEIDGWNEGWPNTHLFPKQVIQVCKDVHSNKLFPIHFGVFDLALHRWNISIREVAKLANESDIQLITPIMGEQVDLKSVATKQWWHVN